MTKNINTSAVRKSTHAHERKRPQQRLTAYASNRGLEG